MASKNSRSALRENTEAIIIAVVIAMFIRTFVVQAFKIPSGSMLETLQIGDQILVNKFIYGVKLPFTDGKVLIPVKTPEKGDIVVFKYPEDPTKDFIKRVVATAGDTVEIKQKQLYVNGEAVKDEPYAQFIDSFRNNEVPRDNFPLKEVPENKIFVMGDNRDNSHDSRFWGFVDLTEVRGEAFMIYWSWDKNRSRPRWKRIGNLLF